MAQGAMARKRRRDRRQRQRASTVASAAPAATDLIPGAVPAAPEDDVAEVGRLALEALAAFAASSPAQPEEPPEGAPSTFAATAECAGCGHAYSDHLGATGPCKYEDGRGTCSCGAFAEASPDGEASAATPRTVTLRFDFDRDVGQGFLGRPEDESELRPWLARLVAEGRGDLALEDALALPEPAERLPAPNASPAAPEAPPSGGELRWRATLAPEATETDDGRAFAPGALDWRELPLSLGAMLDTPHADVVMASQVCGRIDSIYREGSLIVGEGAFDGGEFGQTIARMVADGSLRGISVDVAVHEYEMGARSDYFDEDGRWIADRPAADGAAAEDERSVVEILFGEGEDAIFVITAGTIGAATVCPFQAFREATIEVEASLSAAASPAIWTLTHQAGFAVVARDLPPAEAAPEDGALTAAAAGIAPLRPPTDWFRDPELDQLTPLTVGDDGRVFGHAWAWDTCHIGIPGACTTAPTSEAGYAYYLLKEVECDGGERVACGTITIDAPHADRRLGRADAAAHYDHTGLAVADVVCGEDEHGGWVAGAVRPDASAEKVRALRGAVLSGDWRNVNGNLELVALLAVNVPGFPVPRQPAALVSSGEDGGAEVLALVSAGVHHGPPTPESREALERKLSALADQAAGRYGELAARARA